MFGKCHGLVDEALLQNISFFIYNSYFLKNMF